MFPFHRCRPRPKRSAVWSMQPLALMCGSLGRRMRACGFRCGLADGPQSNGSGRIIKRSIECNASFILRIFRQYMRLICLHFCWPHRRGLSELRSLMPNGTRIASKWTRFLFVLRLKIMEIYFTAGRRNVHNKTNKQSLCRSPLLAPPHHEWPAISAACFMRCRRILPIAGSRYL